MSYSPSAWLPTTLSAGKNVAKAVIASVKPAKTKEIFMMTRLFAELNNEGSQDSGEER